MLIATGSEISIAAEARDILQGEGHPCLLFTADVADDLLCVDLDLARTLGTIMMSRTMVVFHHRQNDNRRNMLCINQHTS